MTPYQEVRERHVFPYPLYPFQVKALNYLTMWERVGYYLEPGAGKTATSTHHMLWLNGTGRTNQWIVALPPILMLQWDMWLRKITNLATGRNLTTTVYAGTPKQRQGLSLDSDFIITSYGLLKNDFERLYEHCETRKVGVLADEATAIKNIESDTHKAVATLALQRPLLLLTGTPVNKPLDAYAYIKLLAPTIYGSRRRFERLHVATTDDYGKPTEYANLELLASNMKVQTSRVLRREVMADLPAVVYTPIHYKLDPEHIALYKQIANERLIEFEGAEAIDAISAGALRSALQQVIVNFGEFAGDDRKTPKILDLIDEVMEELGGGKLVVVANFRRTNRYLVKALAKYSAVAVFGDVSASGKQEAIKLFVTEPSCKVIILHPESAGFGVDGLQHVCSDMLVVEAPTTPTPFQQVVARLDRDGQKGVVNCRVAIAQGTVQVGMFKGLLSKDELVNKVQRGYKDLRSSVYGD